METFLNQIVNDVIIINIFVKARTQQLLQQNRELLEHLASLGGYTETDRPGLTAASIGLAPQVITNFDFHKHVCEWFLPTFQMQPLCIIFRLIHHTHI